MEYQLLLGELAQYKVIGDIINAAVSNEMKFLILITIIDIMTGWIKAFYLGTIESDMGIRGLVKHIGAILIVILSAPLFRLSPFGNALWTMVVLLLILSQAVSILENWSALDLPLPKAVSDRIRKAKDTLENSEDIWTAEDLFGQTSTEGVKPDKEEVKDQSGVLMTQVETESNTAQFEVVEEEVLKEEPLTRMEKNHPDKVQETPKPDKTK